MMEKMKTHTILGGLAIVATAAHADNFAGLGDRIGLNAGHDAVGVQVADLNGDGHTDIIALVDSGPSLVVFHGRGDETFEPSLHVTTLASPFTLVAADFNEDDRPDVVVSAFNTTDHVLLHMNDGSGALEPGVQIATGDTPRGMAAADFDGDTHIDLAVVNYISRTLMVYRGNGDGTFQSPTSTALGNAPWSLVACDVNGDTHPDVVMGRVDLTPPLGDNELTTLLNDGTGAFTGSEIVNFPLATPAYLSAGDVSGDGIIDLATILAGGMLEIRIGQGDGTFVPGFSRFIGEQASGVVLADVELDGDLDAIAIDAYTDRLFIFIGDGSGGFLDWPYMHVMANPRGISLGDVNGDTVPDVVLANDFQLDQAVGVFPNLTTVGAGATFQGLDITFGQNFGGSLVSLMTSDDRHLMLNSQFGFSVREANLTEFIVTATVPDAGADTLDISIEGFLDGPGGTGTLRLRNWSSGRLDIVHTFAASQTETIEAVRGIDASSYVRAGDGRIELAAKHAMVATFSPHGFFAFTDHISITLE